MQGVISPYGSASTWRGWKRASLSRLLPAGRGARLTVPDWEELHLHPGKAVLAAAKLLSSPVDGESGHKVATEGGRGKGVGNPVLIARYSTLGWPCLGAGGSRGWVGRGSFRGIRGPLCSGRASPLYSVAPPWELFTLLSPSVVTAAGSICCGVILLCVDS